MIPKLEVQIFKSVAADKIHDTAQSMAALETAYKLAHTNSLIMPFIEFRKYMRPICDKARHYEGMSIPKDWLDLKYKKSSTYAKHLHNIRAQYITAVGAIKKDPYRLTGREKDILQYLCQGLTRKEIADNLYISINSVKKALQVIYDKMGVESSTKAVSLSMQMRLTDRK